MATRTSSPSTARSCGGRGGLKPSPLHTVSAWASRQRLSAAQFARAVRAHRGIENRLHWVLDVVFHDDLMRLRTDNEPASMAVIRHSALNLFRSIPDKAGLEVRRKTAAWDDDSPRKAITQATG